MPTVYDVNADRLIDELSRKFKKDFKEIKSPAWAQFVKTSVSKERAPEDEDWWFKRCASILRKLYIHGPVGVSRIRTVYGGRKNRGRRPEKFCKGSGSIIRNAFKQLQEAGLVEKVTGGRKVTHKGQSLLDKTASEILKQTIKSSNKDAVKD